ncbi:MULTISPECIES: LacI family DNA-binding transcriptional regulator [Paraburkholderia]|uniref:LacI family DNA-binding transcriptional regulator n=1 Tax=Paraburkholderia TaxID=1822464 RepID=UPI001B225CBB|nr:MULTISPECIES: LacI family DNA-binding transcriptional regulator [Paraburkholderia]MCX4158515.1 LacI family DNA-binding transcriptional regulator [Paraburkholderia aspalathi]MDN7167915.1 LacI family DNA-binding transcriptional regulator [Paraburkholderia sp. SECH2]MDQ6396402.1 LacI family DNA-binding transcriptional regulator [Paraburkholderia aspalathi]CAE6866409.1 HTH-type transcriptional regulator KdgR [Paraburkholderia aspalathi]
MSTTPLAAPRRATITDVAREAGTGKTSISRYLNGEMSVLSPELRSRIEAAIERLNYQPNQMARGLKRGRNRLIGMLLADLTNPYSVEVLQGVEAACHALGLMPLICHAANEVEMERRYLQLLTTYRVEGVIVNALGVREETLRPVGGGGIPAVLVDRSVDGLVADMVGLDNRAAAELGTRHLLDNGFDDIWFVVQPFEQVSSRQLREAAFREVISGVGGAGGHTLVLNLAEPAAVERALAELDRAIDADGGLGDAVASVTGNATSSVTVRTGGKASRIALFAANAPVALCLALHLKARYGADWQARVALLSIDDPEWAELTGITAIRQPTYEIGYRAVEFLHERIEGVQATARDCLLPGELIVRASTLR